MTTVHNKNKSSKLRTVHVSRGFRLLLFFLFLIPALSFGQSKAELERQRKKLQQEIRQINSLLFKSKNKAKTLLSDLNDLNKRIKVRQELIETIEKETKELEQDIAQNKKQVQILQKHLENLKKEYAEMVRKSYKSRAKQSRLMFVLSAENFLQAYKRLQYIQQYADYRKKQGEEILVETIKLENLNEYLQELKQEKELLLIVNKKENDSILKEKSTRENMVKTIKKKERKYITEIRKKQKAEKAIERKLEKIIRDAIAKSNKNGNVKSSNFKLTPEAKKLEKSFIANKGKLPAPVKRGVVIRRYGKQKHPTMDGIMIESTGIHYATEKSANARAVFNGKVLAIQKLPGNRKNVLIQHGNYISVYNNLDNVLVKTGDIVKTKQQIGKIHTDKTTGKTVLIFGLFKGTQRQNPEKWVYGI
jgi:septal ring factor EnvC (AmiA/AmiB activator)